MPASGRIAEDARRMTPTTRRRAAYALLALGTIAVGLGVHFGGSALAPVARDVLGDALWAAMIAWWVGAIAPEGRIGARSAVALVACLAVEASQLIHSPGLDAVRGTRLGHLVLGSDFDPRDLLAYAGGVVAAAALEASWSRMRTASRTRPNPEAPTARQGLL
jgi:hypothetical protein